MLQIGKSAMQKWALYRELD